MVKVHIAGYFLAQKIGVRNDLLFACNRAQPCALKADPLHRGGRLVIIARLAFQERLVENDGELRAQVALDRSLAGQWRDRGDNRCRRADWKLVVEGKSVYSSRDSGGTQYIKKTNNIKNN